MRGDYSLIILDAQQQVRETRLIARDENRVVIGRSETADIRLTSPFASREHLSIEMLEGTLSVTDLYSCNGAFIDGKYTKDDATPCRIKDGSVIRIGRTTENGINNSKHTTNEVTIVVVNQKSKESWQQFDLSDSSIVSIGRDDQRDICLKSTSVSHLHATLEKSADGYVLKDCKSSSGTYVNGHRIESCTVTDKDVISIAAVKLILNGDKLLYQAGASGIDLQLNGISKTVRVGRTQKVLLQDINLHVEPSEFVAIIGGSGAGKTTLLNAMSGFDLASSGSVLCNGIDLYKNYSTLKGIIGYVPQQDIIHENLKLERMLMYAAKLRLEDSATLEERKQRVDQVLDMVELSEQRHSYVRTLSGGQRKRASIAVELLADPGLFFLDEPTSGLDPENEKGLMKLLESLAYKHSKTIIMITHTVQNIDCCDKIVCIGAGGRLCYYDSPAKISAYFAVGSTVDIFNCLRNESEYWSEKYQSSLEPTEDIDHPAKNSRHRINRKRYSPIKQFFVLLQRNFELLINDKIKLLLVLLQPPAIAILIAMVADTDTFEVYESTRATLFALMCACIWMGVFNSIQEVCKERPVLRREYMSNLKLSAYILSKASIQVVLCTYQAASLVFVFNALVSLPESGVLFPSTAEFFISLALTIFSSSCLGLIISSVSKNADRAMTAAPFMLLIQLLFSGVLFILEGASEYLSFLTISRWSISALGASSDLNALELYIESDFPMVVHEAETIYEASTANLTGDWLILGVFVVAYCIISGLMLLRLSRERQ